MDGPGRRFSNGDGEHDRPARRFVEGTWREDGSQTYSLVNSWAYVPGTYDLTLTYTLTPP